MSSQKKGRKKSFSFESSMEKLEQIVKDLESGELSLEQSLASFEQGVGLFKQCRDYLEEARQRVEVLLEEPDGGMSIESYEEDVEDED